MNTSTAPVGTSGNASYVNPFSPTTGMATSNTPNVVGNQQAAAKLGVTIPGVGGGSQNQSTTTLSSDKSADVQNIQNKTNSLSQVGVTTDPTTGVATYANGSIYNPPTPSEPTTPTSGSISQQGGYNGDTYVKPGDPIPQDANGNDVTLTALPPQAQSNVDSYTALMARSDAQTASLITSITQQYQQLIQQQTKANTANQAGETTLLLRNGGLQNTGSGANVLNSEISYGLSQLSDLTTKESTAIVQAQQAGLDEDFQLQGQINSQIEQIRQEKTAILTKQANDLVVQNQKLADQKIQASKDSFVASQMSQGITDPATILKNAQAAGFNTISADDVSSALSNINPNSAAVITLATKYPDAGITPQDTIGQANAKILNSPSYSLDQKSAALDVSYKQAQIANLNQTSISSNSTDVAGWVANIKSGQAKLSDITGNPTLKNAVSTALSQSTGATSTILQTTQQSLQELNEMVNTNNGFSGAVGFRGIIGTFTGPIAGTSAADFAAKAKQVVNDIVLPNLTILHGLGRVTDREFQALQSAITSLSVDPKTGTSPLSEGQFKTELQNITDRINLLDTSPDGAGPDLSSYQNGGNGQPTSNGVDLTKFNQ